MEALRLKEMFHLVGDGILMTHVSHMLSQPHNSELRDQACDSSTTTINHRKD